MAREAMVLDPTHGPGVVDTLVEGVRSGTPPRQWSAARGRIGVEHDRLAALLVAGGQGYGVTTRVGHRDDESIAPSASGDLLAQDEFQRDLLDSHRLPARRWATRHQVRCITWAKAQLWSLGGSGVDPEIYDLVLRAAADRDFAPTVPLDASYSCGDVIPGAWWASGLLTHYGDQYLGPKQGLTLINGVFVHAGVCLASLDSLTGLASTLREVATAALVAGGAKLDGVELAESRRGPAAPPLLARPVDQLRRSGQHAPGQDPVSIRATGSVLVALQQAIDGLRSALGRTLTTPSDNPVLYDDRLVEQDSFMSIDLVLATSSLIEALLLAATWLERAIAWLCGGRCGLPPDLRDDATGLGLIQVPKLATAQVERLRAELARRAFASGSSTSHGIEDLWTNGLVAATQLDTALITTHELLSLSAAVVARAGRLGAPRVEGLWGGVPATGTSFRDDVAGYRAAFDWCGTTSWMPPTDVVGSGFGLPATS